MMQRDIRHLPFYSLTEYNDFKFEISSSVLETSSFEFHMHDFAELAIILGGTAIHITDAGEYPVAAGDLFVLNSGMAHGFNQCRGLHICNIMYDPDQLLNDLTDVRQMPGFHALFVVEPKYRTHHPTVDLLRLSIDSLNRAKILIDRMIAEYKTQPEGYVSMIQAYFTQLVIMLSRLYKSHIEARNESIGRLSNAITLIETRYSETLTLDDLAVAAHLSKTHLRRLFNETFDLSPMQYVLRLRIAKACHLLHNPDLSVADVAQTVGFDDSNYFARQFKKIMGHSPRQHRLESNHY